MKRAIYITLIVIFVIVALVCAWLIADYFHDAKVQQERYKNLASIVEQNRPSSTQPGESLPPAPTTPDGEPALLPEYAELYAMNPDLVGWICIEGTTINYPVMQTPEAKDYYLRRNFDKEDNAHGCIFVRESCDVNAPSDNVTIYGHRMRDGTMFAGLAKYEKKSYWEEHRYIHFDTLTRRQTFEIIAVFRTTASKGQGFRYHVFENAANAAEFGEFVAKCNSLSLYDTGVTAVYGDKLICLSTCEYSQDNGRLVVVAKRISE